ncbi:VQ motif-containing protein 25-like [Cicer arietinum]|uniref:VQ motif-containing protein 25-like n=1 Tax=Cicer arietinum TaxID=3827 RepID=A0A1S2XIA7_CICAR|nr:VQ motif-containing protein 25-like [Cicer arietinum]
MKKLHTSYSNSTSSKLGVNKDSQVISKVKPKIRIIHIYAPEIIKTDAANFRELVQRLTGKPEDETERGGVRSKSNTAPLPTQDLRDLNTNKKAMIMQDDEKEFLNHQNGIKVKNENEKKQEIEEDIWRRSKSNEKFSGFLDGFSELDGFMDELSTIPLLNQN